MEERHGAGREALILHVGLEGMGEASLEGAALSCCPSSQGWGGLPAGRALGNLTQEMSSPDAQHLGAGPVS